MWALLLPVEIHFLTRKRFLTNYTLHFYFYPWQQCNSWGHLIQGPSYLSFESAVSRSDCWDHLHSTSVWVNYLGTFEGLLMKCKYYKVLVQCVHFTMSSFFKFQWVSRRKEFCNSHLRLILTTHYLVSLKDCKFRAAQDHTAKSGLV